MDPVVTSERLERSAYHIDVPDSARHGHHSFRGQSEAQYPHRDTNTVADHGPHVVFQGNGPQTGDGRHTPHPTD